MSPSDIRARVLAEAHRLGFDAVGVARAEPLGEDFARYEAFLRAGMHGEMEWLAESRAARARVDVPEILAGAKSVVCVAKSYKRDDERDPPFAKGIARYARGRDYHNGLRKKVRKLAELLRALGGEARPMIDDAPVLERAWAVRAGLGFVGKNGMLIVPGVGSMVLLGEIATTLEIEPDVPDARDRCGRCTRCLEACPTGAFVRPFVLDARRCVAYLTIELRGPIPIEMHERIGERFFGCDDCQTVCPFNAGEHAARGAEMFAPLPRYRELTIEDVLRPGVAEELARGSPLHRATPEGLRRNAAIALHHQRGTRVSRRGT